MIPEGSRSLPLRLRKYDGLRARQVGWLNRHEVATLPLRYQRLLSADLVFERKCPKHGPERLLTKRVDHFRPVGSDILDRLLERLDAGVRRGAAPAIRLVAGELFERLEIVLRARGCTVPPARTQDTFRLCAEAPHITRESGSNGGVEHLGIVSQRLRLPGDHKRIARVTEPRERRGAALLG